MIRRLQIAGMDNLDDISGIVESKNLKELIFRGGGPKLTFDSFKELKGHPSLEAATVGYQSASVGYGPKGLNSDVEEMLNLPAPDYFLKDYMFR